MTIISADLRCGGTNAYFITYIGINGFESIADILVDAICSSKVTFDELARTMAYFSGPVSKKEGWKNEL